MTTHKKNLALLVFFILAVVGFAAFRNQINKQASRPANLHEVQIEKGASFNDVSSDLADKGVITSETIFKIYGLLSGNFDKIKPGRYFLPQNIEISKLVGILVHGPEEVLVTVTPGMTLAEVDDELSDALIIRPGELINLNAENLRKDYPWLPEKKIGVIGGPLEGFMMPDTYKFFVGTDAESAARVFLENFQKKAMAAGGLQFFSKQGNILKIINLASILEKEVPDNSERRLVAGILNNRLNAGMPLQTDAVLIYGECGGRFLNCPALTKSDYKKDFDYNIYIYKGLPPGPISNPSIDAIFAALNPQKTNDWYYLSDPKTGKTYSSQTLDQHNDYRAKYLGL